MKFTQQQLELMNDFELNVVAANVFYEYDNIITSPSDESFNAACLHHDDMCMLDDNFNPLYKWSDCGDLIDECNINTTRGSQMCSAASVSGMGFIQVVDVNVKRAVTIVYILVKQSQK